MQFVDTHAHLTFEPLRDDVSSVLSRAGNAGVVRIISVGTDPEHSRGAVKLAERYPEVFASVGIHPHECDKYQDVESLKVLAGGEKVVAVGETGLDYHFQDDPVTRRQQVKLFESHLELALSEDLPVIVHCREAFEDVIPVIRGASDDLRGVVHCFSGSRDEAKMVLDLGWQISLTGIVTFKRSDALREVAKYIGPDRIMIETDCPYMSPEPVRKSRYNEPANVRYIAEKLCSVFNLPIEVVSEKLWKNTQEMFKL